MSNAMRLKIFVVTQIGLVHVVLLGPQVTVKYSYQASLDVAFETQVAQLDSSSTKAKRLSPLIPLNIIIKIINE